MESHTTTKGTLISTTEPQEVVRWTITKYYNESTGMEHIVHVTDGSIRLEAWHEDVGQVSWYIWTGTEDDLIDLILEEEK